LSSKTIEALGGSVNYVFAVGDLISEDKAEEKIAYVKCARDGNEYCVIMEAAVTKLTRLLNLARFVDSQYFSISPRSGQNLLIIDSDISSHSSGSHSKKIRISGSRSKGSRSKSSRSIGSRSIGAKGKPRRSHSSSLSERFRQKDSQKIPAAVSKSIHGMTLGKIYENSNTLKGDILFNHFVSLFEPDSNRDTLRKMYRSNFIWKQYHLRHQWILPS
jgi:hypothetical protein